MAAVGAARAAVARAGALQRDPLRRAEAGAVLAEARASLTAAQAALPRARAPPRHGAALVRRAWAALLADCGAAHGATAAWRRRGGGEGAHEGGERRGSGTSGAGAEVEAAVCGRALALGWGHDGAGEVTRAASLPFRRMESVVEAEAEAEAEEEEEGGEGGGGGGGKVEALCLLCAGELLRSLLEPFVPEASLLEPFVPEASAELVAAALQTQRPPGGGEGGGGAATRDGAAEEVGAAGAVEAYGRAHEGQWRAWSGAQEAALRGEIDELERQAAEYAGGEKALGRGQLSMAEADYAVAVASAGEAAAQFAASGVDDQALMVRELRAAAAGAQSGVLREAAYHALVDARRLTGPRPPCAAPRAGAAGAERRARRWQGKGAWTRRGSGWPRRGSARSSCGPLSARSKKHRAETRGPPRGWRARGSEQWAGTAAPGGRSAGTRGTLRRWRSRAATWRRWPPRTAGFPGPPARAATAVPPRGRAWGAVRLTVGGAQHEAEAAEAERVRLAKLASEHSSESSEANSSEADGSKDDEPGSDRWRPARPVAASRAPAAARVRERGGAARERARGRGAAAERRRISGSGQSGSRRRGRRCWRRRWPRRRPACCRPSRAALPRPTRSSERAVLAPSPRAPNGSKRLTPPSAGSHHLFLEKSLAMLDALDTLLQAPAPRPRPARARPPPAAHPRRAAQAFAGSVRARELRGRVYLRCAVAHNTLAAALVGSRAPPPHPSPPQAPARPRRGAGAEALRRAALASERDGQGPPGRGGGAARGAGPT